MFSSDTSAVLGSTSNLWEVKERSDYDFPPSTFLVYEQLYAKSQ